MQTHRHKPSSGVTSSCTKLRNNGSSLKLSEIWVYRCAPDLLSTFPPRSAHFSSAVLTLNQPHWGVQVQSSTTGVSPFRLGPDNKGRGSSDREEARERENVTYRAQKCFGEMPILAWTHHWRSKFFSRKRETLLRFSPALVVHLLFFIRSNKRQCFSEENKFALTREKTRMTLTHNPSFHQFFSFLPPTPLFLSVRTEGRDGRLLSARGSDNDTV